MKRLFNWGMMILLAALLIAPYFKYERFGEHTDAVTATTTGVAGVWNGMDGLLLLCPLVIVLSFKLIWQFQAYVESVTQARVKPRYLWMLLLALGMILLSLRPWTTETSNVEAVNDVMMTVTVRHSYGIRNIAYYTLSVFGLCWMMHLLRLTRTLLVYQAEKQKKSE